MEPAPQATHHKGGASEDPSRPARRQLEDVGEYAEPVRRGTGDGRRHRQVGPGRRVATPGVGTANAGHRVRPAADWGLAAFANWCAIQGISPEEVDDAALQRFLIWLENRTLYPRPRDLVRRVPNVWNEASAKIEFWPKTKLTILSFRAPRKRLQWNDLSESFRLDAEAYLTMRGAPDLFDDRPNAPRRPLAASTLRQQREHLRLAASVLVESGVTVEDIKSLADLVQPEPLKRILRHYHERANGQPNAFAICLAQTLTQVTQYHVGATADELAYLKRIASKLPPVPHELTPKNKALLRQFESEAAARQAPLPPRPIDG